MTTAQLYFRLSSHARDPIISTPLITCTGSRYLLIVRLAHNRNLVMSLFLPTRGPVMSHYRVYHGINNLLENRLPWRPSFIPWIKFGIFFSRLFSPFMTPVSLDLDDIYSHGHKKIIESKSGRYSYLTIRGRLILDLIYAKIVFNYIRWNKKYTYHALRKGERDRQ